MSNPIAWMVDNGEGGFVALHESSVQVYREKGWSITPLVAAPSPQTVEEVREMLERYVTLRTKRVGTSAVREVRAVERHLLSLLSHAAAREGGDGEYACPHGTAPRRACALCNPVTHFQQGRSFTDEDVWNAFAAGAMEARTNGGAPDDELIFRSADAYVKSLHLACAAPPEGAPTYAEIVESLRALVREVSPIVDNADGYDVSNFAGAIHEVQQLGGGFGAWSAGKLLDVEVRAREAWRSARGLLSRIPKDANGNA
jgi:hypothetical protein